MKTTKVRTVRARRKGGMIAMYRSLSIFDIPARRLAQGAAPVKMR
jgi:hypothetical protein